MWHTPSKAALFSNSKGLVNTSTFQHFKTSTPFGDIFYIGDSDDAI
jgi:hypothetical protein